MLGRLTPRGGQQPSTPVECSVLHVSWRHRPHTIWECLHWTWVKSSVSVRWRHVTRQETCPLYQSVRRNESGNMPSSTTKGLYARASHRKHLISRWMYLPTNMIARVAAARFQSRWAPLSTIAVVQATGGGIGSRPNRGAKRQETAIIALLPRGLTVRGATIP